MPQATLQTSQLAPQTTPQSQQLGDSGFDSLHESSTGTLGSGGNSAYQLAANSSSQVSQLKALQRAANSSSQVQRGVALQRSVTASLPSASRLSAPPVQLSSAPLQLTKGEAREYIQGNTHWPQPTNFNIGGIRQWLRSARVHSSDKKKVASKFNNDRDTSKISLMDWYGSALKVDDLLQQQQQQSQNNNNNNNNNNVMSHHGGHHHHHNNNNNNNVMSYHGGHHHHQYHHHHNNNNNYNNNQQNNNISHGMGFGLNNNNNNNNSNNSSHSISFSSQHQGNQSQVNNNGFGFGMGMNQNGLNSTFSQPSPQHQNNQQQNDQNNNGQQKGSEALKRRNSMELPTTNYKTLYAQYTSGKPTLLLKTKRKSDAQIPILSSHADAVRLIRVFWIDNQRGVKSKGPMFAFQRGNAIGLFEARRPNDVIYSPLRAFNGNTNDGFERDGNTFNWTTEAQHLEQTAPRRQVVWRNLFKVLQEHDQPMDGTVLSAVGAIMCDAKWSITGYLANLAKLKQSNGKNFGQVFNSDKNSGAEYEPSMVGGRKQPYRLKMEIEKEEKRKGMIYTGGDDVNDLAPSVAFGLSNNNNNNSNGGFNNDNNNNGSSLVNPNVSSKLSNMDKTKQDDPGLAIDLDSIWNKYQNPNQFIQNKGQEVGYYYTGSASNSQSHRSPQQQEHFANLLARFDPNLNPNALNELLQFMEAAQKHKENRLAERQRLGFTDNGPQYQQQHQHQHQHQQQQQQISYNQNSPQQVNYQQNQYGQHQQQQPQQQSYMRIGNPQQVSNILGGGMNLNNVQNQQQQQQQQQNVNNNFNNNNNNNNNNFNQQQSQQQQNQQYYQYFPQSN